MTSITIPLKELFSRKENRSKQLTRPWLLSIFSLVASLAVKSLRAEPWALFASLGVMATLGFFANSVYDFLCVITLFPIYIHSLTNPSFSIISFSSLLLVLINYRVLLRSKVKGFLGALEKGALTDIRTTKSSWIKFFILAILASVIQTVIIALLADLHWAVLFLVYQSTFLCSVQIYPLKGQKLLVPNILTTIYVLLFNAENQLITSTGLVLSTLLLTIAFLYILEADYHALNP